MAVKFIFEDNEKMPCCQLLLHCFQHENIFFSNGNTLLWAKTMELYNECDEIFIIMDTVPDNPRVMALYYKIYMQVRKYCNIHLIPIPCIEYIIIKMLKKYDYLEYHSNIQELIEYLIEDFQWGLISDELKRKGNLRYTERAYKYILENVKLCMHNEFNNKNHQCGKFYLEDCKCSDCKSFGNELLLKAEQLYISLPYYEVCFDEHRNFLEKHGLSAHTINLKYTFSVCRELYQKMCRELQISNIPLEIVKVKSR